MAVSGDLTRNQDRMTMPIMGALQSWDSPWDFDAMSYYNTITSITESSQVEGLIYAGTDDGLIQVTENGGKTWRAVEVSSMPGVPATAFVNDLKADLHDVDTVYAALDNHKYGDFKPYLLKSADRGITWTSIQGNLPDRMLIWRVVQDHVKPELLFAGTEFGIYFSVNGGGTWIKLTGGVPTISFRDLAIQKRENDLVGASFGRGFYVLDDYSALRSVSEGQLAAEAILFPIRKAWWYIPRSMLAFSKDGSSQGAAHYVAKNPDFGAVFTYYLRDGLKTKEQIRQAGEKEKIKNSQDIPFPGWDALSDEKAESKPSIWVIVKDADGNTVRRVKGSVKEGINRVAWDLRYPSPEAVGLKSKSSSSDSEPAGFLVVPGKYSATLAKELNGEITILNPPVHFDVVPLRKGVLKGSSHAVAAAFWRSYEDTVKISSAVNRSLGIELTRVKAMKKALSRATAAPGDLDDRLNKLRTKLQNLQEMLYGNRAKLQVGQMTRPTIGSRLFAVELGLEKSTYGPTPTHRKSLEIAKTQLQKLKSELQKTRVKVSTLGKELLRAGAPWVEGIPLEN